VNSCGSDATCGSAGSVSVFSTDIGTGPVATIPVGSDPLGVAFTGPWVPQQRQTQLSTSAGPALTEIYPNIYAAETVNNTISYEQYNILTGSWSSTATVPGGSSSLAPALTAVGSTLWVAWTTASLTVNYNELDTTSGTWSYGGTGAQEPDAFSDAAPALADVGGSVYLAWKTPDIDEIAYAINTGSWSSEQFVPSAASSAGPAIAALPDSSNVYFAWKGQTNRKIYYSIDFGSSFSAVSAQPQASTNVGPALAVTLAGTYLMWKSATTKQIGWALLTASGWTQEHVVPYALTGASPGLTAAGANLYLAWQGNGHTTFWYDSFD